MRHQIRVHAAELGFPLLGDGLYGGPKVAEFRGQALHAALVDAASIGEYVCFPPITGKRVWRTWAFPQAASAKPLKKSAHSPAIKALSLH